MLSIYIWHSSFVFATLLFYISYDLEVFFWVPCKCIMPLWFFLVWKTFFTIKSHSIISSWLYEFKLIFNAILYLDLPREVVSSSKPREEGAYWGYQVRYAHNISAVFNECTYKVSSHLPNTHLCLLISIAYYSLTTVVLLVNSFFYWLVITDRVAMIV